MEIQTKYNFGDAVTFEQKKEKYEAFTSMYQKRGYKLKDIFLVMMNG